MTSTASTPAVPTKAVDSPPGTGPRTRPDRSEPAVQAFWLLRVGFFLLPVLFGADKFFNGLTYWPSYLWVGFPHFLAISPQHAMYIVGAIEIAAGIGVLLLPRIVAYVIVAWLAGIITNLVIISAAPGPAAYWDIAFRDLGLLIGALALARLASFAHRRAGGPRAHAAGPPPG